jgi:hypothetical protein
MWRRVAWLVFPDASSECNAFIFKGAVADSSWSNDGSTQRRIPQEQNSRLHRTEDVKIRSLREEVNFKYQTDTLRASNSLNLSCPVVFKYCVCTQTT